MTNDTCYILALIKRDDGERMLLGSGYYQFTAEQKHFTPNIFANDVVELQGTDGQILAGQVRRSASQNFDGYIGDGTVAKNTVEQKRRDFFLFFRKQHHYTVVYIMPDGTAIKRDRGYITDAPAVQELYQLQPKWHIALAFEDVNYYSYAEDAAGNEVYSYSADLTLAAIETGGLEWDANGAISEAYKLSLVDIKGDTFQQTYTGKNLFDKHTAPLYAAYLSASGVISGADINDLTTNANRITYIECEPSTTYTITKPNQTTTANNRFRIGTQNALNITKTATVDNMWRMTDGGTTTTHTYTTGANAHYMVVYFGLATSATNPGGEMQDVLDGLQIETGSIATSYEPFVGGQASPSPDYPQAIQTVTGEQTVTINSADYPISLGSIELCKITYSTSSWQDYIYKDGDDWKIHKATATKTFSGADSEDWGINNSGTPNFWYRARSAATGSYGSPDNSRYLYCNYESGAQVTTSNTTQGVFVLSGGDVRLRYGTEMSLNDWKAKLATTNMVLTYALATATDTVITDAALIAQLNAVEAAIAESTTTPTVTATSPNLPAILGLTPNGDTGGYIFDANSGGGPVNVTVNGVDSATPVWHVYGPCTNPTLTNSTTGEALTWGSTVPSGQELIIDMGAQTATLEGANVFEYVSGSWVTMQPGINRISYTAGNTTDGSRIYWNEVVG